MTLPTGARSAGTGRGDKGDGDADGGAQRHTIRAGEPGPRTALRSSGRPTRNGTVLKNTSLAMPPDPAVGNQAQAVANARGPVAGECVPMAAPRHRLSGFRAAVGPLPVNRQGRGRVVAAGRPIVGCSQRKPTPP